MGTMDINLSEALKAYVDKQVASGRYPDASAFLRSLLEAEVQRRTGIEVEHMLLEVVAGPFEDWTEQDVEEIRRSGHRLIERRRPSG